MMRHESAEDDGMTYSLLLLGTPCAVWCGHGTCSPTSPCSETAVCAVAIVPSLLTLLLACREYLRQRTDNDAEPGLTRGRRCLLKRILRSHDRCSCMQQPRCAVISCRYH